MSNRFANRTQPLYAAGGAAVAAQPATPAGFRIVLALFAILMVARISDIVPGLQGLPIGKLLGVFMILFAALWLPREDVRAASETVTFRGMIVIAVLGVLSVPLSVWPGNSVGFLKSVLLPAMVFFFIASVGFADRRTTRLTITLLVLSVGAGAIRMFASPNLDREGRARFGSLDANDTAALFVVTIPFALMLASEKGVWRKFLYLLPPLYVAALVKTGSRGGLLGLVAIGIWLTVLAAPRRRLMYVVGIVASAFTFGFFASGELAQRFSSVFQFQSDYNMTDREGRIEIWKRGIGYMVTHPVIGVGIHGFETAEGTISGKRNEGFGIRYTAAHNSLVQIGAELGVGGLVAFVAAFGSAAAGCWRVRRRAIAARAADPTLADQEAAFAGTALTSLFGLATTAFFLSFAYHPITYFCLAISVGVVVGSPFGRRAVTLAAGAFAPTAVTPLPLPAQGWRSAASRRYQRG